QLRMRHETTLATFTQLLELLVGDLQWIANRLKELYEGTTLGETAHELANFSRPLPSVAQTVVVSQSDAPLANWNTTHKRVHIRAWPTFRASGLDIVTEVPFIEIIATL